MTAPKWNKKDYRRFLALREGRVLIHDAEKPLPLWPASSFTPAPEKSEIVVEVAPSKFVIVSDGIAFWLPDPRTTSFAGMDGSAAENVYVTPRTPAGSLITWVVNGSALAKIRAAATIDGTRTPVSLVFEAGAVDETSVLWTGPPDRSLVRRIELDGATLLDAFRNYSATPVQARASDVLKARGVDTIGLFANRDFPANARVTRYLGERIANAQAKEMPASKLTHAFSVAFGHDVLIGLDGSDERAVLEKSASLVNDLDMVLQDGVWRRGDTKFANAKLVVESSDSSPEEVPWLRTTRKVRAGEEFSIDYGKTWRARQNDAAPALSLAITEDAPIPVEKMTATEQPFFNLSQKMQINGADAVRANAKVPLGLIERVDVAFEKPGREYAYFDIDGKEHPIDSAVKYFALAAALLEQDGGKLFKSRGPIVGRTDTIRGLKFDFYGQFTTAKGQEIATRDFTTWDKNRFIYGD